MQYTLGPGRAHKNIGFTALIGSAFAFSLMTVCIKQIQGRIPIAELVFFRSLFSLAITLFLIKKAGISPWGENKKLLFFRGLAGTGALFCIFKSINSIPLSAATIIQYTYPTFTALFAWILIGEQIRKRIFLAIILGWLGIQAVVNPYWTNHPVDNGLQVISVTIALCGAVLTSLAYVTVRKLSEKEHFLIIVLYFPLVSIPTTIPFLIGNSVMPTGNDWLWLLGIGVFTQLGQVLITTGLKLVPAGYAGSITYTQVLFATLWGVLFFTEPVTLSIIIGATFILAATLISLSDLKALQLR